MFLKRCDAAWPFLSEPSSDHTVLPTAVKRVNELSKQVILFLLYMLESLSPVHVMMDNYNFEVYMMVHIHIIF